VQCLRCRFEDTRVIDTRLGGDGFSIKRRRVCNSCGFRFSTLETPVREEITVEKRDGRIEEFDRQKIFTSLRAALKKGDHQRERMETLVNNVVARLLNGGRKRLTSAEIGTVVLDVLKNFDELAYLRYLTVHQSFINLEDFKAQILRNETNT
jgi:transcriptional repressor NrdR